MKMFFSGNEAVARAAIDAGVQVATSYPGTPASDIFETIEKIKANEKINMFSEWAINEKVALEIAIGASMNGNRALCTMKHIGLNAAADPFMNVAYTGAHGGLVIVVADDPGIFSSQNEQDSRHYASFAKIICLEPSDQQEAYDMTYAAFELSEKYESPVMICMVTRISHTSMIVETKQKQSSKKSDLEKNRQKWVLLPSISRQRHKELIRKYNAFKIYADSSNFNSLEIKGKTGIIAAGNGYNYAMEYFPEATILKIGTYPLPEKKIEQLVSHVNKIIVIEEGYPFIEERLHINKEIIGKLSGQIPETGELRPENIASLIGKKDFPVQKSLVHRPPQICVGCAYNRMYEELDKIEADVVAGDIGCYTLGALPPYNAMDSVLCMGASISMAAGLAQSGHSKVIALIGDSTFFHSGITALIDAVHNKANITVIILDNNTVAMTGGQRTPAVEDERYTKINLENIIKSFCSDVTVFRIFDKKNDIRKMIEDSFEKQGVKVFIAQFPCIVEKL